MRLWVRRYYSVLFGVLGLNYYLHDPTGWYGAENENEKNPLVTSDALRACSDVENTVELNHRRSL